MTPGTILDVLLDSVHDTLELIPFMCPNFSRHGSSWDRSSMKRYASGTNMHAARSASLPCRDFAMWDARPGNSTVVSLLAASSAPERVATQADGRSGHR